jgi:hypothetical protein
LPEEKKKRKENKRKEKKRKEKKRKERKKTILEITKVKDINKVMQKEYIC